MSEAAGPPYERKHYSGANIECLKKGVGKLGIVNVEQAAASVTIYDGTDAGGEVIAEIGAAVGSWLYHCRLNTGLYVVITGAGAKVTISYS